MAAPSHRAFAQDLCSKSEAHTGQKQHSFAKIQETRKIPHAFDRGDSMGKPDVAQLANQIKALEKELAQLKSWKKSISKELEQEKKRITTLEKAGADDKKWKENTLSFLDQEYKRVGALEKQTATLEKQAKDFTKNAADDQKWKTNTLGFLDQEYKRVGALEQQTKKIESDDLLYRAKHNNDQLVRARKVIDALDARVAVLEKAAKTNRA